MACRPEEQKRFTVVAATLAGSPAINEATSRYIGALHAVRLGAAEDNVADLGRIERRSLAQNIPDAMRGQVVRARHVE